MVGFGSLARNELLIVSDIDLQIMVLACDASSMEAQEYADFLMSSVEFDWNKLRDSINCSSEATALQIDRVGGCNGILVVNSIEEAASYMKAKKIGSMGFSDIYVDCIPIYESEPGIYNEIFEEYEKQFEPRAVNDLVRQASIDTLTRSAILRSAKQSFLRPVSLSVGGLYRTFRAKKSFKSPYETNTIKRAMFLKEHGVITHDVCNDIETVMLRAFKWEQEAGLNDFKHGQEVLVSRRLSIKTNAMYNKAEKITRFLLTANGNLNKGK